MRDDEKDARDRVHTVDTVPPPAGEDDVYDAKTQIGGLTAEQLAILRQVRDEKPPAGLGFEEILVPVFEDDARSPVDAEVRVAKIVPAAGRPAAPRSPTPAPAATPVPAIATPLVPAVTTVGPVSKRGAVPIDPRARDSDPALVKAAPSKPVDRRLSPNEALPPVAPVFAVRKTDRELAPLFDADDADAEQEPVPPSYVALFAPLSTDAAPSATDAATSSRGRGRGFLLVALVIAVAVVAWLLLPQLRAH